SLRLFWYSASSACASSRSVRASSSSLLIRAARVSSDFDTIAGTLTYRQMPMKIIRATSAQTVAREVASISVSSACHGFHCGRHSRLVGLANQLLDDGAGRALGNGAHIL